MGDSYAYCQRRFTSRCATTNHIAGAGITHTAKYRDLPPSVGCSPSFMCLPALTETQKCAYLSIVRSSSFVNIMPPGEEPEPQSRKRKRAIQLTPAADPQPQPQAKRRKRSRRPRSRTPPEFWDNLSRVPLCHRALREFDRRTVQPVAPKPPKRSVLKGDLVKQLKRFARHGGPNLRDIRGVSSINDREVTLTLFSAQNRKRKPE